MGVFNCSMFCFTLLYVPSSFAIILMGKRELVAVLSLSSWCLVIAVWLFLAVPLVCLQFVIVVFPDHTHLLFLALATAVYPPKISGISGIPKNICNFAHQKIPFCTYVLKLPPKQSNLVVTPHKYPQRYSYPQNCQAFVYI